MVMLTAMESWVKSLHFQRMLLGSHIGAQIKQGRRKFVISGFHREVDENCALLGYRAVNNDDFLQTFRHSLSSPILNGSESKAPEDGTDRLSRSVGKKFTTTRYVITLKSTVLRGVNSL
jgi:hypothetical protein